MTDATPTATGGAVNALANSPHLPRDHDGPVFREPLQAQAFAMALALYERGLFTWPEWADALAAQIAAATVPQGFDADTGTANPSDVYYRQWLSALESLVVGRDAGSAGDLRRWQGAWNRALERTPHGQPIEPRSGDFEGAQPI